MILEGEKEEINSQSRKCSSENKNTSSYSTFLVQLRQNNSSNFELLLLLLMKFVLFWVTTAAVERFYFEDPSCWSCCDPGDFVAR